MVSPDGRTVLSGSWRRDLRGGTWIRVRAGVLSKAYGSLSRLWRSSPDGRSALSGSGDGECARGTLPLAGLPIPMPLPSG